VHDREPRAGETNRGVPTKHRRGHLKAQPGEGRAEHLGLGELAHHLVVDASRVQPHARPWSCPPGAAPTLASRGPRDERGQQALKVVHRVVGLLLGHPRVDDEANVINRDRRLRDVGRKYYLRTAHIWM